MSDGDGESGSVRSAWMLGVCGMGMGPLAIYMRQEGWKISGWDDAMQPPMSDFLRRENITIEKSFDEKNPPSLAGHSNAVKRGHPLHSLAEKHNVRLMLRGELLAERVREKSLIAVCGSHGKTTTSGMLIQALLAAEVDIGYVLGGLYRDEKISPARASDGPWVVAEVDESDGTINHFSPEITVAVNLDWDHSDCYPTEAALDAAFISLFKRTRRAIFIPAESERLVRLAAEASVPVIKVGRGGDFEARVTSGDLAVTRLELVRGFSEGEIEIPVSGNFNISNAVMALAVTQSVAGHLGAKPLGSFSGIRRRQDVLFESGGLRVMADYAHHPTEVSALLRFLRENISGELVAVFQPHRHTRTKQYAGEFAATLSLADSVCLMPVYSAGDAPIQGGMTDDIFSVASEKSKFFLLQNEAELRRHLRDFLSDGREVTVVFIGAGNIDKMASNFVRDLQLSCSSENDFSARVRPLLSTQTLLETNYPLGAKTTLRAGGNARWYAEPASLADLQILLRGAASGDVPFFVLGRGSNLLVADNGYDGLVIRLANACWREIKIGSDGAVFAGSGARVKEIAGVTATAGWDGFAFLDGIPGTLGGALRMNAGAMGDAIFDRVESITWVTPDGELHTHPREFFHATYRDCPELRDAVILGATLKPIGRAEPDAIQTRMREYAALRKESQPREPSAGCSFKNPPEKSAGRMIDELGLKGLRVGDAAVSAVHANFIVNAGDATAADVIAVMRRVRDAVKSAHGVTLEPEIILLGQSWREVL